MRNTRGSFYRVCDLLCWEVRNKHLLCEALLCSYRVLSLHSLRMIMVLTPPVQVLRARTNCNNRTKRKAPPRKSSSEAAQIESKTTCQTSLSLNRQNCHIEVAAQLAAKGQNGGREKKKKTAFNSFCRRDFSTWRCRCWVSFFRPLSVSRSVCLSLFLFFRAKQFCSLPLAQLSC